MVPEKVSATSAAKDTAKIAMMNTRSRRAKVFEGRRERMNWVNAINWMRPKMPILDEED